MEQETESYTSDVSQNESKSADESEAKRKNKYVLTKNMKEKLLELPEILEFITRLQSYVEKQRRKLQKLKKKHKKGNKNKIKHVSTQTGEEKVVENEVKTIAEEITEAAEEALKHTGFVYEETSGMYYDYNSGYYYNAEYGLYYDGNTGTYLRYNQSTEKYEFHSQVSLPAIEKPAALVKKESRRKKRDDKHENKRIKVDSGDLEEGECSDGSKSPEVDDDSSSEYDSNNEHDYAQQWPPCMRIIVEETNVASIKKGTLYVMTCKGGTLGREGDLTIVIPDINVSKIHMGFHFNKETNKYYAVDLGSCNGTFLNGQRLSPPKWESPCTEIPHGSKIQIGGTTLLCHIHGGNQTCGHCEPGLIQTKEVKTTTTVIATTDKSVEYKKQLKHLRKKFGITHGDQGKVSPGAGYTDRAQVRREMVGSQNPHEKTQKASLNKSIDSGNKGFKLLSKMGWKEGQALGKDNQGRLEPVPLVTNAGNSGVGNLSLENDEIIARIPVESTSGKKGKNEVWLKAQARYNKIDKNKEEDIFSDV